MERSEGKRGRRQGEARWAGFASVKSLERKRKCLAKRLEGLESEIALSIEQINNGLEENDARGILDQYRSYVRISNRSCSIEG